MVLGRFCDVIAECADDLAILRQNNLLSESSFITFCTERSLPLRGIIDGEPGQYHRDGLLAADELHAEGRPYFHPFRIYTMHMQLQWEWKKNHSPELARRVESLVADWNSITDLAILLEPLYWPSIVGSRRGQQVIDRGTKFRAHEQRMLDLLRSQPVGDWEKLHENLRMDAHWMDRNDGLYLLLRVCAWRERERLHGTTGGSLWLRHVGEVIRRGFEAAHSVSWLEEDQASGWWPKGTREREFGTNRPLDDTMAAKPYIAYRFGLFTGSAIRWYVEGHTEYGAFKELLGLPERYGIELVNLRGSLETRPNSAMGLETLLCQDKALRRFSLISIDDDVKENTRIVRAQIERGNVVGAVRLTKPDFEFANFTLDELIEVAARFDEERGCSGDSIRQGDWTGIASGREFEARYQTYSERHSSLKSEAWGQALACFAGSNSRPDGCSRPLWDAVRDAVHGWQSDYDHHRDHRMIDPITFDVVDRAK